MFTEPDIQILLDNITELIIFKNISDPVSGHKTKKEKWQVHVLETLHYHLTSNSAQCSLCKSNNIPILC